MSNGNSILYCSKAGTVLNEQGFYLALQITSGEPILSGFMVICAAPPQGNNALMNVNPGRGPPNAPTPPEKSTALKTKSSHCSPCTHILHA